MQYKNIEADFVALVQYTAIKRDQQETYEIDPHLTKMSKLREVIWLTNYSSVSNKRPLHLFNFYKSYTPPPSRLSQPIR